MKRAQELRQHMASLLPLILFTAFYRVVVILVIEGLLAIDVVLLVVVACTMAQ